MGAWGRGARPSPRLEVATTPTHTHTHTDTYTSPETEARGGGRECVRAPGGSPAEKVGLRAGEAKIDGCQRHPAFLEPPS